MEQNIKNCPIHHKYSFIFCEVCKRISCSKCKECEKHPVQTVTELINKFRYKLQPKELEEHKVGASAALEKNIDKTVRYQIALKKSVEETEKIEEKISNSLEGVKGDNILITGAIQCLRGIAEKAFTFALSNAVQKAAEALDVEDEMNKETENYKGKLVTIKVNMDKFERNMKRLSIEKEWLEKIAMTEKENIDEELELALSFCFTNNIIIPPKPANLQPEYKAFPHVCGVFDIMKVETQELIDIGLGVMISRPIVVEKGLKFGNYMLSSLSHNGVLAIHCDTPKHVVQFADLASGKQIDVEVDSYTQTGFFDNSMVMLTFKKFLGVCSVEEMFARQNTNVLKMFGNLEVRSCADVSIIHSTRKLLYTSTSHYLYEFNVDSKMIRRSEIEKLICSFASLAGIYVGVKAVFSEWGNNCLTYSLKENNQVSLMLNCNPACPICTFIPSTSDPKDFNKGMKIYENGSFFTNTTEKAQLRTPFKFQCCQSILRLYCDVFLVYDANTEKWCIVKILVP